jgi:hypothetical protein
MATKHGCRSACFDGKFEPHRLQGVFSWSQCSITPPKFVCIAAKAAMYCSKKSSKIQAIRLVSTKIQQILVRIAAIMHPAECAGMRGGKIFWE